MVARPGGLTERHNSAKFANMTQPLKQVSTSDLRDQIRPIIDAAMLGESTVITRYGSPIAIIAPYGAPDGVSSSAPTTDGIGLPSLGLADAHGTVSAYRIAEEAEAAS